MSCWNELANAIIIQAVKDYRRATKKLAKNSGDKSGLRTIAECKRFFLSDWFATLTDIDGEELCRLLKKENENNER